MKIILNLFFLPSFICFTFAQELHDCLGSLLANFGSRILKDLSLVHLDGLQTVDLAQRLWQLGQLRVVGDVERAESLELCESIGELFEVVARNVQVLEIPKVAKALGKLLQLVVVQI